MPVSLSVRLLQYYLESFVYYTNGLLRSTVDIWHEWQQDETRKMEPPDFGARMWLYAYCRDKNRPHIRCTEWIPTAKTQHSLWRHRSHDERKLLFVWKKWSCILHSRGIDWTWKKSDHRSTLPGNEKFTKAHLEVKLWKIHLESVE